MSECDWSSDVCFPIWEAVQLKTDDLKKALKCGSFCCNEKEPRAVLTGVNVTLVDGVMSVVSTDGKRLAKSTFDVVDKEAVFNGSISKKIIKVISTIEQEEMLFYIEKNCVRIELEDMEIQIQKINGDYPSVDKLFSDEKQIEFTVNTKTIVESLGLIGIVKSDAVTIDGTDKLTLISKGPNKEVKDVIEYEKSNDETFKFIINPD